MKKIFAFLLSASILLSLAACGGAGGGQTTDTDNIITQPVTEQTSDIKETTENADSDPTTDPTIKAPGKTLVVYFSGSGNTKRVAEIIAEESGADTFEIVPAMPYTDDDLNWRDQSSRVNNEHNDTALQDVELVSTAVSGWEDYDTVFFGYPIWWREASWVVNRFVKDNNFDGKTVIPFCTSTSSPFGDSGKNLSEMAGSGNWIDGRRFTENANETDIRDWVKSLNLE